MTKQTNWPNLADEGHISETDSISLVDLAGLIDWAGIVLGKTGLENPRHEARLLVSYGLGITIEQTLYDQSRQLAEAEFACVLPLIRRRSDREPLAHITGIREFWSLEFGVGVDCLIPRPDSECIVESALDILRYPKSEAHVLDLGTGSGCLLLSVMHERSYVSGIGVDCSYEAVCRARDNSRRLKLNEHANFMVGQWGAALERRFDLILCNPPYARAQEINGLMPEVSCYEPHLALDGGADGLSCYRKIAPQLSRLLIPRGMVCIEVGLGQADSVVRLFSKYGLGLHARRTDLGGVERCLVFVCLSSV